MRFTQWLESQNNIDVSVLKPSAEYHGVWYHGTWDINPVLQSGYLKIRGDGIKSRNAAALGIGIYLTNDLEEAKAYVPVNDKGGVVGVTFAKPPKLARIRNNPVEYAVFDELQRVGLENPTQVNNILTSAGFNGIHWDLRDGTQKVVVYDPSYLSPVKEIARISVEPNTYNGKWST